MSKKFRSIKVGAISKGAAVRMAVRINEMCFESRFTNYHGTSIGDGQYVVTLFIDDCEAVREAHVSKVCSWKALLTKQELEETTNEH